MKLVRTPQLDALCGEYLLGSLRGPARRRYLDRRRTIDLSMDTQRSTCRPTECAHS